jgi:hypothetical protein
MADFTGVSFYFALKMNVLHQKSRYYPAFSGHTQIECQTHLS